MTLNIPFQGFQCPFYLITHIIKWQMVVKIFLLNIFDLNFIIANNEFVNITVT